MADELSNSPNTGQNPNMTEKALQELIANTERSQKTATEIMSMFLDISPQQANSRKDLKNELYQRRSMQGHGPICPICGEPVTAESDLHEVLITRGDVQKASEEIKQAIFVPQNCVHVHHKRCHEQAATKMGQIACARYLIMMEGYLSIKDWLEQMSDSMRGTQAASALLLINQVASMMIESSPTDLITNKKLESHSPNDVWRIP